MTFFDDWTSLGQTALHALMAYAALILFLRTSGKRTLAKLNFPYLWEELHLPIPYTADRIRAERILLEAARRHTVKTPELGAEALQELRRRYFVDSADMEPRVHWRLTDNWLDLSVRFVTRERGVREVKDALSRELLAELDAAGIPLASTTFELTGIPPLRLKVEPGSGTRTAEGG